MLRWIMSFPSFPSFPHPSLRIVVLRLRQSQLSSSASTCDDQRLKSVSLPIRAPDYQRQISLLCWILQSPNWNNSIQVLHHVKPIENEGFLLPLKVVPSVWNRQHLQQAAMAVQGPESQATKQLVSVPAPEKSVYEKTYWMFTMQISKSKIWEEHCLPTKPWDSLISNQETLWFPLNFRVSIHEGA